MNTVKKRFLNELPFFFILPAVLWQIIFMLLPLVVILYYSFSSPDVSSWWHRFTIQNYVSLLHSSYGTIILRSAVLAFATAVSCLFAAYPVAYYLAFHARRNKNILLFLLTLPFWVNFLVQIYSWYFLLEHNGLINKLLLMCGIISAPLSLVNSLFAIFIVMVYCYLPFMIMPLYTTLEKIDTRLLESSADLGATPWQTFTRITLPLSFSGIRTGFLLVLIPAFGEFVIPSLMGGGKYMLVGSLISYLFLVARNTGIGSAFTMVSGIVLLAIIFGLYSVIRWHTRKQIKVMSS